MRTGEEYGQVGCPKRKLSDFGFGRTTHEHQENGILTERMVGILTTFAFYNIVFDSLDSGCLPFNKMYICNVGIVTHL